MYANYVSDLLRIILNLVEDMEAFLPIDNMFGG